MPIVATKVELISGQNSVVDAALTEHTPGGSERRTAKLISAGHRIDNPPSLPDDAQSRN